MSKVLKQLNIDLEMEGYKPGSPRFDVELRRRKIDVCKNMRPVDSCWNCEAFDHCELLKTHLRDIRLPKQASEKRE